MIRTILILALCICTANAVQIIDLGSTGELGSQAVGINNHGKVAGWSTRQPTANIDDWPIVYEKGHVRDLSATAGRAYSVNNLGHVCGYLRQPDESNHASFWKDNVVQDLNPSNSTYSVASALNDNDVVVGLAYFPDPGCTVYSCPDVSHACRWDHGVFTDLNDLLPTNSGWLLLYAFGVNLRGDIVGQGWHKGEQRAFLLLP